MKNINIKDYTIRDIEALAEQQAAEMDVIRRNVELFLNIPKENEKDREPEL